MERYLYKLENDALNIRTCMNKKDWDTAKYFRDKYFFTPHGIHDPYTWTFNHKEHIHFLLCKDTESIGYAHIQLWPQNRAAIRIIAIEEEERNKNAGSIFLSLCEQWIKNLGFVASHAESRKASLNFYKKNGYSEMPFNDPDGYESSGQDIAVGKAL